MGFDWLVGQFALPFGSGVYGSGGTQGLGRSSQRHFVSVPRIPERRRPIGAIRPSGPITAGNRSGTFAISGNAVDALFLGAPPDRSRTGSAFRCRDLYQSPVSSRSTGPEPAKGRRSGERSESHHQERPASDHPDRPGIPLSDRIRSAPGYSDAGIIYTPATPTTPTSFETKPVGITLEVEPTVGPDGYTIDLILSPRVVEFDGFINYGSPINTVVTAVGVCWDQLTNFVVTRQRHQQARVLNPRGHHGSHCLRRPDRSARRA